VWVIIAPVFATAIGLAYAVFVDRSRGEKVLKVFIFMPVAISLVGASIIFKFFFDYTQDPQIGLLNQIVEWFGGTPVPWLQIYPLNMLMLIIILIWTQTGFAMVLLSSAIKGVPTEQIEAAELDGTNAWQRFWNVTVPGIRPTIIVVWITISIVALKVYDIIATTTGGQNNTTVLGYEMVKQFEILPPQSGHSAALALLIFLLVTPFIWYNARNLKRQREEL
jgi:alpha-glucoside transport system permease protein